MELPEANDIDALFQEAKRHDTVITADPALADALNARIEGPMLGKLAYTPRQYIQQQEQNADVAGKRELFLAIVEATALDWKQATTLLDNVIDCWQHTGERDAILDHDRYDTDATRQLLQVIEETPNLFSMIADRTLPEGSDVAVIGEYQLNELQRQLLPDDYSHIPILTDRATATERFRLFPSHSAIVRSVKQKIEQEVPDDIGVVVQPGSQYERLLTSRLEAADIPYVHSSNLDEQQQVRSFLYLARLSLEDRIKLCDIQPLLRRHDIRIPEEHAATFLDAIDTAKANEIAAFLDSLEQDTIREAIDRFGAMFSPIRQESIEELEATGLLDEPVSEAALARLAYFLDTFSIEIDREDDGVVLTAPRDTAHLDRPVVFHLGIDADWTVDVSDRPWINAASEEQRHLKDFTALLQAGEQTFYMVQDTYMNDEIQPCLYLNEYRDIERFQDLDDIERYDAPHAGGDGFDRQLLDVTTSDTTMLSASALDTLVHCPRDYCFDQLVEEHRQDYFVKGTLFHDFAEFYLAHPDVVQERGIEPFVGFMLDRLEPFMDEAGLERERTVCRLGLENIMAYLDRHEVTGDQVDGYIDIDAFDNAFAEAFDRPIETASTEMWFQDADLGAKGVVDLILSPDHLVDYKSGSQRSAAAVVRNANPDLVDEEPSFQALLYLTYHRQQVSDTVLRFTFFHFLETVEDAIAGDHDIEDAFTTVRYYPERFEDALQRDSLFQEIIGDVASSNDRRKTLEKLGQEAFQSFFADREIPHPYDSDALLEADITDDFTAYAQDRVGDYSYVANGCRKALKRMVRIRTENFFQEDLDRFESFLQQWLDDLNEWRRGRFPVGDSDLDRASHRDMLLTGDGR